MRPLKRLARSGDALTQYYKGITRAALGQKNLLNTEGYRQIENFRHTHVMNELKPPKTAAEGLQTGSAAWASDKGDGAASDIPATPTTPVRGQGGAVRVVNHAAEGDNL